MASGALLQRLSPSLSPSPSRALLRTAGTPRLFRALSESHHASSRAFWGRHEDEDEDAFALSVTPSVTSPVTPPLTPPLFSSQPRVAKSFPAVVADRASFLLPAAARPWNSLRAEDEAEDDLVVEQGWRRGLELGTARLGLPEDEQVNSGSADSPQDKRLPESRLRPADVAKGPDVVVDTSSSDMANAEQQSWSWSAPLPSTPHELKAEGNGVGSGFPYSLAYALQEDYPYSATGGGAHTASGLQVSGNAELSSSRTLSLNAKATRGPALAPVAEFYADEHRVEVLYRSSARRFPADYFEKAVPELREAEKPLDTLGTPPVEQASGDSASLACQPGDTPDKGQKRVVRSTSLVLTNSNTAAERHSTPIRGRKGSHGRKQEALSGPLTSLPEPGPGQSSKPAPALRRGKSDLRKSSAQGKGKVAGRAAAMEERWISHTSSASFAETSGLRAQQRGGKIWDNLRRLSAPLVLMSVGSGSAGWSSVASPSSLSAWAHAQGAEEEVGLPASDATGPTSSSTVAAGAEERGQAALQEEWPWGPKYEVLRAGEEKGAGEAACSPADGKQPSGRRRALFCSSREKFLESVSMSSW